MIASYAYDYRGRRTQKTVNNATTVFVYDQDGHPLAEASSGGAIRKTYLWRDDTPAVVIDSTGTQDQLYYLQADTLNSPRAARNQAGTVIWTWPQDAFGTRQANEDPDGNGQATKINLRFPGQYYDAETQLHYNWNRYYDPNTGRYISVDPIGLLAGLNPYAYVDENPVNDVDPLGLAKRNKKIPQPTYAKCDDADKEQCAIKCGGACNVERCIVRITPKVNYITSDGTQFTDDKVETLCECKGDDVDPIEKDRNPIIKPKKPKYPLLLPMSPAPPLILIP